VEAVKFLWKWKHLEAGSKKYSTASTSLVRSHK